MVGNILWYAHRQYLTLKYLPFSLLMGCDFQEGFKSCFNCLVLKDTEHQPGLEDGPGRGFRLPHRELLHALVLKGWELLSLLLSTEKATLRGTHPGGVQKCDVLSPFSLPCLSAGSGRGSVQKELDEQEPNRASRKLPRDGFIGTVPFLQEFMLKTSCRCSPWGLQQ